MLKNSRSVLFWRIASPRYVNHAVSNRLFTTCAFQLCYRRSRMNLPVELDAIKRLTASLMRASHIYMSRCLVMAASSLRPLFCLIDIYLSHFSVGTSLVVPYQGSRAPPQGSIRTFHSTIAAHSTARPSTERNAAIAQTEKPPFLEASHVS